jgi:plasmid stability protein
VADLLIRRVPEAVVRSLKRRAVLHRRSLQQELVAILEAAAGRDGRADPGQVAAAIRLRLSRRGRRFSDSTADIRRDRNR